MPYLCGSPKRAGFCGSHRSKTKGEEQVVNIVTGLRLKEPS
jgi:hypothetical protein